MQSNTEVLVLNMILFLIMPLWGLSGLLDWWCHRKSEIEKTSGIKESFLHSLMGAQIGIPIFLGIFFELTVLTYLIMFVFLILHEVVAHYDVRFAEPKRKISIWEMHAHNYLATIPLYIFALVSVLGWGTVKNTLSLSWGESFYFKVRDVPIGGDKYYILYGIFMSIVCVFPYVIELFTCWKYSKTEESIENKS
jgi:hypothetical protein